MTYMIILKSFTFSEKKKHIPDKISINDFGYILLIMTYI